MHELSSDRDTVLALMKQTVFHLGRDTAPQAKSGMKAAGAASTAKWSGQRDEIIDVLQRAIEREQDKHALAEAIPATKSPRTKAGVKAPHRAPSESAQKLLYMPRDRTVALFQAAMDEYLDQKMPRASREKAATVLSPETPAKAATTITPPEVATDISIFFKSQPPTSSAAARTKSPFAQFSNLDPGWTSVAIAVFAARLRGKAKFITHKALTDFRFELPDKTTVALVSDWGGGNDAARTIAAEIKKRAPNYVIHLGDIYYAGTEHEVKNRFLDLWDFESTPGTLRRTFALNGNHEMYSGGKAFFKSLKTLKQPASYFALGNKHWRLIGLDTAYVDHDLNKEQVQWLAAQLTGSAKNVLLSHHQPFSAFEDMDKGENLRERLRKHLDAHQIHGWIWGHEHLCVVYEDYLGIKGRCIGHGCIPYNLPDAPQSDVKIRWWNTRQQQTFGNRGMQGFAMLNIDGASMQIEYIDKDGTLAYTEQY